MKTSLSQALQVLKKSIARKTRSIVLVVIGSIVLTGCATSIEDYNAAVIQGIVEQPADDQCGDCPDDSGKHQVAGYFAPPFAGSVVS